MALQPFAKASDLQVLVPSMDTATAVLTLDLVSGAIRAAVGWDVDQVVDAVYTRLVTSADYFPDLRVFERPHYPGSFNSRVVIPALNLTAVKDVTADDVVLATTDYTFTTAGIVHLKVSASQSVAVTYTAGYKRTPTDQAPPVFRQVALEYAAKLAGNPAGVTSYTLGLVQEAFGGGVQTLADGDSRLDAYRVNL